MIDDCIVCIRVLGNCIMKEVVFYYDVVCLFVYMVSRFIEGVVSWNGVKILWKFVFLGNI